MIKVENTRVYNIANAIYSARNAMNSWDKSDSDLENDMVGPNDLDLAHRLYVAGHPHRKFLRQIMVSMDITAPLYWWAEMDTYKVGVTRNSCSFMHKGLSKPFSIDDFSTHDERISEVLSPLVNKPHDLIYPYETDEYRDYVCKNGRKYKIYKNGKIVSYKFDYTDTKGRYRTFEEKECKPSKTIHGYYEINLGGSCREKWMLHRLVASVWIENKENYNTVNHIDGNKGNNSVENLEWMSLSDNIKDGFSNGLFVNGKSLHARYRKWKNCHTLFNPIDRLKVLNDHKDNGLTCKQLSQKYDITVHQANQLISSRQTENQSLFLTCYAWENLIDTLNKLREEYLNTHDKQVFQQIRCLLPCGYNIRSTITMNYENVFNMLLYRENHKLDEWNELCKIFKDLPYVREIMDENRYLERRAMR